MTDPEVENLLRETFHARESQAPPLRRVRRDSGAPGGDRADRVRRRGGRGRDLLGPARPWRRTAYVATGVATLAVLAGAIFATGALRGQAPNTVSEPAASPAAPTGLVSGWRWESSLGAEIQVPDTWTVNEWGCGSMTDAPTVVRGQGAERMCLPAEPAGKEVAFLTGAAQAAESAQAGEKLKLSSSPTTVDGVPAERAVGRLNDGRYAGSVTVASRDVAVIVRTKSESLTARILDSLRLVDVDHLGCTTTAGGPPIALQPVRGKPAVPAHPSKLIICLYLGLPRLQSSTQTSGELMTGLSASIQSAKEGRNPDAPASQCLPEPPQAPDLVLLADGVPLSVVFSPCVGRGITDGQRWAHVSKSMVAELMEPTHAGYGLSADLD